MPHYVSKDGVWYPAKEHAVLPHLAGTPNEVYDGPDRAAEHELALAHGVIEEGINKGKPKVTTFGQDFRENEDMIELARSRGFQDTYDKDGNVTMSAVEKYAKQKGWTKEKSEKEFKSKAAEIVMHKEPERKEGIQPLGGGKDLSGQGNDRLGGFGEAPKIA